MSHSDASRTVFDTSTVCDRYERLRAVAFGQSLAPEDRYGLLMLLRFGMWQWACNVEASPIEHHCRPNATSTSSVSAGQEIVIRLLAQVAMATHPGRVQ